MAAKQPPSFDIGYKFPILAEVTDIIYDDFNNPKCYEVTVVLSSDCGFALIESTVVSPDMLVDIEAKAKSNMIQHQKQTYQEN
jgi:hypothetical protein